MEIRIINSDSQQDIMRIIKRAFYAEPWNDRWDNDDVMRCYLSDIMDNKNSLSLALFDGERLVGAALGRIKHWFDRTEFNIDDFCIDPDFQGRGSGSEFVSLIKEYARCHGIEEITLKTDRTAPAYKFYQKNGFEEMTETVFFRIACSDEK